MCQYIDVSVRRYINLVTIRQYQFVDVSICQCVPALHKNEIFH